MLSWQRVRQFQGEDRRQLGTLYALEMLVKPGIRQLGLQRTKEINTARKEEMNLLLLRQLYLTRKLQQGQTFRLGELKTVHLLIERWYNRECEKVQKQSRADEFQTNEKSSIYHHELHKKVVKKGAILKLKTEDGLLEGHTSCAAYLEQLVEDLLHHPAQLDPVYQLLLL